MSLRNASFVGLAVFVSTQKVRCCSGRILQPLLALLLESFSDSLIYLPRKPMRTEQSTTNLSRTMIGMTVPNVSCRLINGADVADKDHKYGAICCWSGKEFMSSRLCEKRHCRREEKGKHGQNPNGVEGGVGSRADGGELIHCYNRYDQKDEDDRRNDQTNKNIHPGSFIVMNVLIDRLDTQFRREKDVLGGGALNQWWRPKPRSCIQLTHPNEFTIQLQQYRLYKSIEPTPFSSAMQGEHVFLTLDELLLLLHDWFEIRNPVSHASIVSLCRLLESIEVSRLDEHLVCGHTQEPFQ